MSLTALLLMAAQPATSPAETVSEAIADGRVGERFDGYLDFVTPPEDALRRAVRDINIRRRLLYGQLAERRSVAPREVGITAGCNLLARTRVGGWYQLPGETWQRREAGQVVALPAYCDAVSAKAK